MKSMSEILHVEGDANKLIPRLKFLELPDYRNWDHVCIVYIFIFTFRSIMCVYVSFVLLLFFKLIMEVLLKNFISLWTFSGYMYF